MSNAPQFIAHIRDLIAKDKIDTAIQELKKLLEGSPRLTEVLQQSARYHRIITEQRLGVVDAAIANLEQNKISLGLLELLDLIAEEVQTDPTILNEMANFGNAKTIIQNAEKIYNINHIDNANFS